MLKELRHYGFNERCHILTNRIVQITQ